MGVRSMRLKEDDYVIDLCVTEEGGMVLSISENGYGKRTDPSLYTEHKRGGGGMIAMGLNDKTGLLSAQLIVHDDEDILLITDDGTIIRTPVSEIRVCGRSSQGVRLMRIAAGSRIISVCRADHVEEQQEDEAPAVPAETVLSEEYPAPDMPDDLSPADTDDTAGAGGEASPEPEDEL